MSAGHVCRACLALDVRPQGLNSALLSQYETITGLQVDWGDGRPLCFCCECAARVAAQYAFRDKCHRAHNLLEAVLLRQGQVTEDTVKSIDRAENNLLSTLSYCQPNDIIDITHCDIFDVKNELVDEKQEVQSEETVKDELDSLDFSDDDVPLLDIKNESDSQKKKKTKKLPVKVARKRITKPRRVKDHRIHLEEDVKKRGSFKEDFATEILLTKEQQLEELNLRATTLNYLNSPYKCTLCYKGFVDDAAYRNHVTKHDASSGDHACEICRMRYTSARRLRAHAVSSHARKYACKRCELVTHTANQAREHDKWHSGHVYSCGLCGETFRKPTSHLTHMRKRHPTEFVCDVCGDSFVGRHGLMMHKKKTHKIEHVDGREEDAPRALERYCRECDVEFTSVEAWRRHTVTSAKHALNNDFGTGCRICGERFDSRERLALHARQQHARPRAGDPPVAVTHLQCDQCPAKFASRSKLLAHVRRVHLGVKYNKNIVCELCGKSCTSNATLKYHQRTHTGERPYACAECPRRFSDRNQLRIHTRTHTDERPYACALCAKTFRQKPALNRHARVHTGAKPYECQHCGKTFSQSNSLKIHVHTVHLKLPPLYRGRKPPAPAPPLAGADAPLQRL